MVISSRPSIMCQKLYFLAMPYNLSDDFNPIAPSVNLKCIWGARQAREGLPTGTRPARGLNMAVKTSLRRVFLVPL